MAFLLFLFFFLEARINYSIGEMREQKAEVAVSSKRGGGGDYLHSREGGGRAHLRPQRAAEGGKDLRSDLSRPKLIHTYTFT